MTKLSSRNYGVLVMDLKKLLSLNYYKKNTKKYKDMIKYDYLFNSAFCGDINNLPNIRKKGYEYKYVKIYRKYQVNSENIWGKYYRK